MGWSWQEEKASTPPTKEANMRGKRRLGAQGNSLECIRDLVEEAYRDIVW
jgi:hypothetical protein